jgi:endonuclease YncB( thermonuclease family)
MHPRQSHAGQRRLVLEELQKETREAKKGLRADPQPVSPWDWQKSQ